MRVTIQFEPADERDDEVIDITRIADGYLVESNDHTASLMRSSDYDQPFALIERAIYVLRRKGLR
jgi:hypothetical protein